MPYITMCQGPKCTANGAGLIIRDMEDLAFGVACVEASGCMGQCSKGPNGMYSEKSGAKGKITNKLNKYSKLTEMLGEVIQGFGLDELQSRVHKVKFAIRREANADTRMQAIEETMAGIDDQEKEMHPELLAEMLCLRSRELTKADPIAAYNDLREALKLLPDWPWAFVSLAQVLDNLHMPRGALASMQRAIEIGTGVDKNALTRGMVRLDRKAADAKGPDVPPEGVEMDIRYVKEKSLGGELTQKDKKGKDKDKAKKEKEPVEGDPEDKGDKPEKEPEKTDKSEKKEKKEKTSKTKDGKEVKASKAKSKSKKDKSAGASKKLPQEEPKAESPSDVDAAVPTEPVKEGKEKAKEKAKSEKPETDDVQSNAVTKSMDLMKDLLVKKREDKEAKVKPKDPEKVKSKHGDEEKKKKKKKTKKKKPEKSEHGEYQEWQLRASEWANHDCVRMTFACKGKPAKNFESPIWHIDLAANVGDDGEEIQRSYTPYSTAEEYKKGILILIIKVYPNGRMSSYLGKMKAGDNILVSKPVPTIDPQEYPEGGIMVAGGSAVVVALQVITAMLPLITDSFHLYLCNRRQEDVLLMQEFNELMQAYPNFHMTNCLSQDKSPENPEGRAMWSSGRLNAEQLKTAPSNLKVMISGPDPLCKMVALAFLELGKQEDDIACLDTDLDEILHPDGEKEEDLNILSRQHTHGLTEKVEERPPVDVPRARIKAAKSMVISIDALAAASPRISRPPNTVSGLGLFSSLFCRCSSDAGSEGSEEKILQKT